MRKLIILVTIVSVLILTSCYYQVQFAPDDYDFSSDDKIQVSTKDTVYNLNAGDYSYANDTLFAAVPMQLDKRTKYKLNIKIPSDEIEKIEVEKTDAALSILATVGVLTALFGVVILLIGMNPGGLL